MKINDMNIDDLIPYENNPRNNDEAVGAVVNSIEEFGFKVPIIIDSNNVIVAGHTRLKAAQKLGLKEVPVIVADDLNEDQIKAFRLADNKVGELTSWDFLKLEEELSNIEMDMSEFDFDMKELSKEFDKNKEVVEDDFDVDQEVAQIEEPVTKQGDVWLLGNHRLMCGDSTSKKDVEILMNGNKLDLLLTDPPYNVALGNHDTPEQARQRHRRTDGLIIMNDKMSDEDFLKFLTNAFSMANEHMKAGASFYIWHADNESLIFRMALKNSDLSLRQTVIWNKSSITLGRQDYQWKHEPCLYGWKEGASHNWYSDRKQTTVLEFNKPSISKEHPTMKPLDLIGYQVKNSSKENDIVTDLFGGSGSTLIACEQLERKCYMMELDPKYCDVIIKRWETLTGQKATLEGVE